MGMRRILAATAATVLVASGAVFVGASPASADQIWQQQVQRVSADATCDIPPVEGDAAGWSAWEPSWAQWPNDGKGGWVCERTILWAKDTPPPSSEAPLGPCVDVEAGRFFGQFNGEYFLDKSAPVYADITCTVDSGEDWSYYMVYAPAGVDAEALCLTAWGKADALINFGRDVWGCTNYL